MLKDTFWSMITFVDPFVMLLSSFIGIVMFLVIFIDIMGILMSIGITMFLVMFPISAEAMPKERTMIIDRIIKLYGTFKY
jgi:hypothetical protein